MERTQQLHRRTPYGDSLVFQCCASEGEAYRNRHATGPNLLGLTFHPLQCHLYSTGTLHLSCTHKSDDTTYGELRSQALDQSRQHLHHLWCNFCIRKLGNDHSKDHMSSLLGHGTSDTLNDLQCSSDDGTEHIHVAHFVGVRLVAHVSNHARSCCSCYGIIGDGFDGSG